MRADQDAEFMARALTLAEFGRGQTRPNPVVGAVIARGSKILAEGFHSRVGGPHAEVDALQKLGGKARGATLYVSLEPCCHQGRTGPCTDPIIASGIKRVVVAVKDPNPRVNGRGLSRLRRAGLEVELGLGHDHAVEQNRGFFRWIQEGRPHVTLKAAATLDGFMAPQRGSMPTGQRYSVTGAEAHERTHRFRAAHDAILVGLGTVLADDPRLDIRLPAEKPRRDFLRVVLDSNLSTPPEASIFRGRGIRAPLIISGESSRARGAHKMAFAQRRSDLEHAGAEILELPRGRDGRVPLRAVLTALAEREIQSVLVEGGATIHGGFIGQDLVDSIAIFLAPRLQGQGVPISAGPARPWQAPIKLGPWQHETVGDDLLLQADVLRG